MDTSLIGRDGRTDGRVYPSVTVTTLEDIPGGGKKSEFGEMLRGEVLSDV
jgi:hypothetical protein